MRDSKGTQVAAALVLTGALGWLGFYFYTSPPPPHRGEHEAIGQTMAQEAIKLQGSGGKLILIARDTSLFDLPAAEFQRKGFFEVLKQAGRKADATNVIKLDPGRLVAVPPGEFFETLRRTTEADVVVSFMGPPELNRAQVSQLKSKKARVVALCTGGKPQQVDLRALFQADLLHAAIVSRPSAARPAPSAKGGPAWFDALYQVITAANVVDLNALYLAR